jgi:hypothetical protein
MEFTSEDQLRHDLIMNKEYKKLYPETVLTKLQEKNRNYDKTYRMKLHKISAPGSSKGFNVNMGRAFN